MTGIFNSSIFNNKVFNTGASAPSVILLGGGPGGSKWDKKKHEYFFTPAWQKFEQETRELDAKVSGKEQELSEARQALPEPAPAQTNELAEQEQLAAYEALARQETEKREQFLIYEQNMLKEINELRIRRARLIRQRQEEAVILAILLDSPPLH